jgi:Lytic transglycolase
MTRPMASPLAAAIDEKLANAVRANRGDSHRASHTIPADSWRLTYRCFGGATFTRKTMSTATFVFMIATYWVGGSAPTEGGKYLANGQVYNNKEFVAAHRTLPFGTILNVCLRRQCVAVVVKDRGPFLPKMDIERRIDLSYGAAKALGMLHDGRQRVRVSVPMPIPRPDIERREAQSGSSIVAQSVKRD